MLFVHRYSVSCDYCAYTIKFPLLSSMERCVQCKIPYQYFVLVQDMELSDRKVEALAPDHERMIWNEILFTKRRWSDINSSVEIHPFPPPRAKNFRGICLHPEDFQGQGYSRIKGWNSPGPHGTEKHSWFPLNWMLMMYLMASELQCSILSNRIWYFLLLLAFGDTRFQKSLCARVRTNADMNISCGRPNWYWCPVDDGKTLARIRLDSKV